MQIAVGSLLRGAQEAEGTAIIIDVFRAFTTAAVAFSRGAERIVLVAEVADALRLRDQGHGDLCMGEVSGMRPEGFDFGNSPYELSRADVDGRRLIQSTRAGTVGVAAATRAERIYAGSLVTAEATAKAVLRDSPEIVSIVAMGAEGQVRSRLIRSSIPVSISLVTSTLRQAETPASLRGVLSRPTRLDQPGLKTGQSPVLHILRQHQPSHKVAQVVGQDDPAIVSPGWPRTCGRESRVQFRGVLALLDPLLRRATAIVKADYAFDVDSSGLVTMKPTLGNSSP